MKNKYAYEEYEKSLNEEIMINPNEEFSVIVCDVNNLKQVNDTMGHIERADRQMYKRKRELKRLLGAIATNDNSK